jgi:hypothetical protein
LTPEVATLLQYSSAQSGDDGKSQMAAGTCSHVSERLQELQLMMFFARNGSRTCRSEVCPNKVKRFKFMDGLSAAAAKSNSVTSMNSMSQCLDRANAVWEADLFLI